MLAIAFNSLYYINHAPAGLGDIGAKVCELSTSASLFLTVRLALHLLLTFRINTLHFLAFIFYSTFAALSYSFAALDWSWFIFDDSKTMSSSKSRSSSMMVKF